MGGGARAENQLGNRTTYRGRWRWRGSLCGKKGRRYQGMSHDNRHQKLWLCAWLVDGVAREKTMPNRAGRRLPATGRCQRLRGRVAEGRAELAGQAAAAACRVGGLRPPKRPQQAGQAAWRGGDMAAAEVAAEAAAVGLVRGTSAESCPVAGWASAACHHLPEDVAAVAPKGRPCQCRATADPPAPVAAAWPLRQGPPHCWGGGAAPWVAAGRAGRLLAEGAAAPAAAAAAGGLVAGGGQARVHRGRPCLGRMGPSAPGGC